MVPLLITLCVFGWWCSHASLAFSSGFLYVALVGSNGLGWSILSLAMLIWWKRRLKQQNPSQQR